jgi:putative flavoprotein involved in K+ transport
LLRGYGAGAPVREHTDVLSLERAGTGFSIATTDGPLQSRQVVVATGPFQRPRIPPYAAELPAHIVQSDPTRYRNPQDLPAGAVLVVGAGASGIQITEELVSAGRTVFLAVSRHRRMPRRFRGRDIYWWMDRLGRFEQTIDTFPGRRWPPHTAVTGVNGGYDIDLRRLAGAGARVVGSVRGIRGTQVMLASNVNQILDDADAAYLSFIQAARSLAASLEEPLTEDDAVVPTSSPVPEAEEIDIDREGITSVLWATGYQYDYGWLHADVFDAEGRPVQQRGVTAIPGLYFLGLHWMHTFKSGLLSGVGSDAAFLADRIDQRIRAT